MPSQTHKASFESSGRRCPRNANQLAVELRVCKGKILVARGPIRHSVCARRRAVGYLPQRRPTRAPTTSACRDRRREAAAAPTAALALGPPPARPSPRPPQRRAASAHAGCRLLYAARSALQGPIQTLGLRTTARGLQLATACSAYSALLPAPLRSVYVQTLHAPLVFACFVPLSPCATLHAVHPTQLFQY